MNIYKEIEAEELGCNIGENIQIHGMIYKIREMSGFAFVLLRTKNAVVQCIYNQEITSFSMTDIKEEASVKMQGVVVEAGNVRGGCELLLHHCSVLSTPSQPMPVVVNGKELQLSLDTLLHYRPLTLRNEKERAIFKLQEGLVRGIRNFLESQGFTEIHTPKIAAQGAEGGANIFTLDYFGKKAYLAQSPQFYKQMLVGVFERVYEIAPVFRAEKHDTARHLNEYTSVDFEMGFIEDFTKIMDMEECMLKSAFLFLQESYRKELEILNVRLPQFSESGGIPRIKFDSAKELVACKFNRKMGDKNDLDPEEERLLSQYIKENEGSDFVFVTHYPSSKRPFYTMDSKENPSETLSFDLLLRGMEVTTGGQRIHDYEEQLDKLKDKGLHAADFESYLTIHKHGMPPHGGLGLGLERLTSLLLGFSNVRRGTMFPRDTKRLTP